MKSLLQRAYMKLRGGRFVDSVDKPGSVPGEAVGNKLFPVNGVRLVKTLDELDVILEEADAAEAISDDALRHVFTTFRMEFPLELPGDPYSNEYRKKQFELYEYLAGKPYGTENEVSIFDVGNASSRPFPFFTGSPQTVGNHLIAIGHLIRTLDLPENSSVLEFGPGWGNTTVWLARMGYTVTAVDIENRFVELIRQRAKQKQLEVEAIQGDFQFVHQTDRQWDAVLFFECFHHCADHHALIEGLDRVIKPGGRAVFAAEPITDDFPLPWGLRLDGESLWAIRKNGWCELGFQETYFRELLAKNGWFISKHVCSETPWGTILVATRQ
jgi:2-polyprenyl-3-methyl-5-hydroxy-6-metoxy-1,4-benzoquinol methylase